MKKESCFEEVVEGEIYQLAHVTVLPERVCVFARARAIVTKHSSCITIAGVLVFDQISG